MQVRIPTALAARYKSASQRARVISEAWGEENLYCPNCTSPRLERSPANTEAIDYTCPWCDAPYQLKSQARPFARRINDAAYDAMKRTIVKGRTPNLLVLHYQPEQWEVQNLLLIPHFVFSLSAIERRKPLASTARRSGWVGCNILLVNIPLDAKIRVVTNGIPASAALVRRQYNRLRPLQKFPQETRGWTMDILNVVRALGKLEFVLADVYAFSVHLRRLHPQNRRVQEKIRQQLQCLRDLGFLEFVGRGSYRLKN